MPDWLRPTDAALFACGTADDPRLGARVERPALDALEGFEAVLVGVPDDRGVVAGGGRAGAAEGPAALRRALYRLTPGMHGQLEQLRVADLGDVEPAPTVEETHERLAQVVKRVIVQGAVAVVVGGGHDHSYGSVTGLVRAVDALGLPQQERLLVVNVDTHLDVRPLKDGAVVTSGTPFRRLLEAHPHRLMLAEVGVQPLHAAAAHLAWAEGKGATVIPLAAVRAAGGAGKQVSMLLGARGHPAALSLDLDAAAGHVAPGVSAPPADGLGAEEILDLCRRAGKHGGTALLDVMELAPPLDPDGRTARLAAAAVWHFLAGLAARRSPPDRGGY